MIPTLLALILTVTNANDDGAGSLRDAIVRANALCAADDCRIEFRIPATTPWTTIRLERPLPPLLAPRLAIYGTTQTVIAGDTNPEGPELELSGALLTEGSGLEFATCTGEVYGLAINGFPANGITVGGPHCTTFAGFIGGNYIGTDPTGTHAVPNGRGIWMDTRANDLYWHWEIVGNVISGNRSSGVFVASGPQRIRGNVIGLTAKHDAPLGNGASGVAVLAGGSGTDVDDNYIGFNHHFGVAVGRGARKVAMNGNSFQANWQLAIDWDMDGVSPANVVDIPTITSVTYADGVTTLVGTTSGDMGIFPRMNFYANDAPDPSGYGEGQYFLGAAHRAAGDTYTLRVNGDLRGKWIAATATHVDYYGFLRTNSEAQGFVTTTSEFSRAVEVR